MEMRGAIAPCGLDCSACNLFLAPSDQMAAETLVEWFRHQGWLKPNEGASEIMSRGPYCNGCRGDRSVQWSGDCRIRACCTDQRKLESCSACADFPCAILTEWGEHGAHHAAALERLRDVRGHRG
jgi:hypothetical protein